MLKGVNRQVLEINQPESRYFERILFIVKPEYTSIGSARLLKEAQRHIKDNTSAPPQTRRGGRLRGKGAYILFILLVAAVSGIILLLALK